MSEDPQPLETMSCEELLKELARLGSERDHAQAQGATPANAIPEQTSQVESVLRQAERMQRIGELIKSKGCQ